MSYGKQNLGNVWQDSYSGIERFVYNENWKITEQLFESTATGY